MGTSATAAGRVNDVVLRHGMSPVVWRSPQLRHDFKCPCGHSRAMRLEPEIKSHW